MNTNKKVKNSQSGKKYLQIIYPIALCIYDYIKNSYNSIKNNFKNGQRI